MPSRRADRKHRYSHFGSEDSRSSSDADSIDGLEPSPRRQSRSRRGTVKSYRTLGHRGGRGQGGGEEYPLDDLEITAAPPRPGDHQGGHIQPINPSRARHHPDEEAGMSSATEEEPPARRRHDAAPSRPRQANAGTRQAASHKAFFFKEDQGLPGTIGVISAIIFVAFFVPWAHNEDKMWLLYASAVPGLGVLAAIGLSIRICVFKRYGR
ncbi:hypothetical protein JCM11641_007211 [Rhodosporidiobolus odoratus]